MVIGMFLLLVWYLCEFLLRIAHYLFSAWFLKPPSPPIDIIYRQRMDEHYEWVVTGLHIWGWASVTLVPVFLLGLYWVSKPPTHHIAMYFPHELALGACFGVVLIFTKTSLTLAFLTEWNFIPHSLFSLLRGITGSAFLAIGFAYLARVFLALRDGTFTVFSLLTGAYVVLLPLALWLEAQLGLQLTPNYSFYVTAQGGWSIYPPRGLLPLVVTICHLLAFGTTTLILFQLESKLVRSFPHPHAGDI